MSRARQWIAACASLVAASACTHELQVKNLDMYRTPFSVANSDRQLHVAVRSFEGGQDDLFYFNSLVERLNANRMVSALDTDYMRPARGESPPDVILSIQPHVDYRTSLMNFVINWPGFLIFTPAWNGYVYRADIMTRIQLEDGGGRFSDMDVPISYSMRHADFDRTIFTGLTWLEVSALAFFGGIYNASSFDRDAIAPLQYAVKDNYTAYVLKQLDSRLERVARELGRSSGVAPVQESPGREPGPLDSSGGGERR